MTNFEKIVKDGDVDYILETDGLGCALYEKREGERTCYGDCGDCEQESWEWLQQEYEPPLLENGDNLKPGDWIMVKIGDVWEKRSFLCFDDGLFYTVDNRKTLKYGFNFSRWEFARLPEEGE